MTGFAVAKIPTWPTQLGGVAGFAVGSVVSTAGSAVQLTAGIVAGDKNHIAEGLVGTAFAATGKILYGSASRLTLPGEKVWEGARRFEDATSVVRDALGQILDWRLSMPPMP